jgi:hypothetical protein
MSRHERCPITGLTIDQPAEVRLNRTAAREVGAHEIGVAETPKPAHYRSFASHRCATCVKNIPYKLKDFSPWHGERFLLTS